MLHAVRVDESANHGIVEARFQVIKTKGGAIIVPTVAEAVELADMGAIGNCRTACIQNLVIAPCNTS